MKGTSPLPYFLLSLRAVGLHTALLLLTCCCLRQPTARADEPVIHLSFSSEQTLPMQARGNVLRDQAGPRPPAFPDFNGDNTAVRLDGKSYLAFKDPVDHDRFDFRNGDEITLEAWVKLEDARDGQQTYVIGKGRTGNAGMAKDNQNWALRTVSQKGIVRLSFLFASKKSGNQSHWHRWTSTLGFTAKSGWHHIAVTYRFGNPKSIGGWIDGVPTDGAWDMGGATTLPPVVDEDDVWVGSASGGNPGNSFRGWLDEVAVHREILDDKELRSRFKSLTGPRIAGPLPEEMPNVGPIPAGRVLMSFAEGMPDERRWLIVGESWPAETTRLLSDQFLLNRIPIRYDDWGIRSAWKPPVLARCAADVVLPVGTHEFVVRTRSLARLWIDGKLVARIKPARRRSGNLEPVEEPPEPLSIGGRRLAFTQQETIGSHFVQESKTSRVVLEFLVGSKKERTDPGESLVAIRIGGEQQYRVLSPNLSLSLTDRSVTAALKKIDRQMTTLDDSNRRQAAASQDGYWRERHDVARGKGTSSNASIEDYIDSKLTRAKKRAAQFDSDTTEHFHETVLPLLREQCFRCHGDKAQGGLRLTRRESALLSGDSGIAAVVPGKPAESELVARIHDDMPPTDEGLSSAQIEILEQWVADGAPWPAAPLTEEETSKPRRIDHVPWIRRVYFDTVGVPPTLDEFAVAQKQSRESLVDELLHDVRYADHWVSFWLDILAENPTLLNTSLGSTGPFRWFLYDSLRDNKPVDRMVTELIMMRGDVGYGGSSGFQVAGENDAPLAAKAHILSAAFLGIETQCARCHDSPYHSTTQEDLYNIAAMLARKPITPPASSRVPDEFFEEHSREPLIRVSLPLGEAVKPQWPFEATTSLAHDDVSEILQNPRDSRERLAALITSPRNSRFAKVLVNHLWKRLIGAGLVEPVHDWEGKQASHPKLLDALANDLIGHDYDLKYVLRRILLSDIYSRSATGRNKQATPEQRFFVAPDRRRLSAEQVVDALFTASGREMDVEELTFVHDNSHTMVKRLTLGVPKRAWMFAGLNNERDRPSLSMPRAQSVVDVLEAFGWTGTRQKPVFERETNPNILQPGILANGDLTMSLSRAAVRSDLAELAIQAESPEQLVSQLFIRFLSREPNAAERDRFSAALSRGFSNRSVESSMVSWPAPDSPLPQSTWTNHLQPEANEVQLEWLRRVRRGPHPDPRLNAKWREVYEDVVWSLINHGEFVWLP